MKLDIDYLKRLLVTLEEAPTLAIGFPEFKEAGFDIDEKWIHHILMLGDEQHIVGASRSGSLGISYGRAEPIVSNVPIRMTAQGHEFLDALRNDTVWSKLKRNFGSASLSTLQIAAGSALKLEIAKLIG